MEQDRLFRGDRGNNTMMTNEEIVQRIETQLNVAIALRMMAQCFERLYGNPPLSPHAERRIQHLNKMAGLFTRHAIRLTATHRKPVEQWMRSHAQ